MLQLSSIIRRIGLMLLLALQLSAFSQSYTVIASSGNAYIPLVTPNVIDICRDEALSDPIIDNIFMGFKFVFAGKEYWTIRVSSNGFLSFVWDGSNIDGLLPAVYIPIADTSLAFRTEPIIAPFWEDLTGDAESKALYSYSSEKFILEWQNWKWKNTRISFQVIFYKSTGIIEFCYKGIPANIENVKVGIQIPNGDFISPTNPTAVDGQKYQFIPVTLPGNKIQGLHFTMHKTEALEHAPKKYANILEGVWNTNINNNSETLLNPPGNGNNNCHTYKNNLGYYFEKNGCSNELPNKGYTSCLKGCNFNTFDYPSIIAIPIGGRYYNGQLTFCLTDFGVDWGYRFQQDIFYSNFAYSYAKDLKVNSYKAQLNGIIESGSILGNMPHNRILFKREEFGSISIDSENNKWFGGTFICNVIKYNNNQWVRFNEKGIVSIENDGTKWIGDNYNFVEYSSPILYKSLNDEDFDLGHIATSGLPVTYTSTNSGVATIVDGKVHIVGLGSTTIETNQAGNAVFKPLPTFRQTLVIKESNIIELDSIAVKTYGDSDFYPLENSSSGLPIAYKCYDSTIVSIVNGKIHIKGVGTCNIYANQKGDEIYGAAKTVRQRLTVNPMPIEVIAQAKQKVYGENDPKLTYNATPNLVNNDSFTGTLSRGFGDNAGSYPIRQGTLSAGDNYSITYQEANFTISKKNLNVKAENKSKNYGEANPELSLSFEGFVNNEDKSVIDALPTIACTATQNSNSGSYPIELSGGSDNNYDLALENGTLQVNPILGTVNTTSIQNITSSTVDVYGELTSHGGEENIVRGFVYGTSANPTILNSNVEVGSGMGAFSQTINGLTPNVKYYVRSYAYNSVGTVYGNELFFTTLSTGITEPENSEVTIYPNPTTGIVYFKYIDPNAKIEIYNLKGELVQMTEPRDNQISIKNLLTGTYIIKIISDDKIKTIKVVKE